MGGKDEAMDVDRSAEGSLPWVEKYRPATLGEMVSQDHIVGTVESLMDAGRLPHLLFYGPPGTGKTTAALAIARKLHGNKYKSMTLELNASDDRGIGVVRDQIKTFASTQQIFNSGCKFIILDEADSMTKSAQFSLRRIMEKYTKTTRFCIICNYVNKIIPALQSRCTRFRFSPLSSSMIEDKLFHIAKEERVNVTPDGMKGILHLSNGDMRKCLNIMQASSMAHDVVDESSVYLCTGNATPEEIRTVVQALFNSDFKDGFHFIHTMQTEKGLALSDLIGEVHAYVQHVPDLPNAAVQYLLEKLADIESDVSKETTQKIQLGAFVGVFQIARQMSFDALKA